ncbi:hypothetical protein HanRHA438_Chr03g0114431 [Helianthus annuus]|nr:hypothetical protein HanRHA438_Chr03g0114431 [Helianthus annuus]
MNQPPRDRIPNNNPRQMPQKLACDTIIIHPMNQPPPPLATVRFAGDLDREACPDPGLCRPVDPNPDPRLLISDPDLTRPGDCCLPLTGEFILLVSDLV